MSRRARMILPVLGALALATAACGPAGPTLAEPDLAPTTAPPSATAPISAPTTTSTSVPPVPHAVTIAFGGDVYGEAPIRAQLARGENPLDAVAPLLAPADVAVVNLETAVGSSGAPRDKEFVFQADPALLTALTGAGVDVVSVANNHSFDHGLEGFLETLDHVAGSGLLVAGGGHDAAEAYAPAIVEVHGVEVAIIGVAVIGPDEADRAVGDRPGTTNGRDIEATLAAIAAARARTPVVVAVVHWGAERTPCPRPAERDLAQRMLDAGASAVVGGHPHVVRAIRADRGKLVAYSIGNFLFAGRSEATRRTGVLTLTVEPDGRVSAHRWDPARIDDAARPIPLVGSDRDAELALVDAMPVEGAECGG